VGDLLQWKGKKSAKASVTGPPQSADGPQPLGDKRFVTPRDILLAATENSASIERLVLLVADEDGNLGLISNLDSVAENLLFIEGIKRKILEAQFDNTVKPTPPEAS
jgi:hypothetical protein